MHPLAHPGRSGANGMMAGDRVLHVLDGRIGIADEFLHDGETFVTWEDGTFGTVKWRNLRPHEQKQHDT